mmetsp:Transcript_18727/g.41782  ORF Transcript_18727/g.41782 Transcript_18727/m.41782 type:complete len:205 (-) Transcript_18727:30-644(-)
MSGTFSLPFLAVGRISGAESTFCETSLEGAELTKVEGTFKKMLGAAAKSLKPGDSKRLTWEGKSVIAMVDQLGFFMAFLVADKDYPERHGKDLLKHVLSETSRAAVDSDDNEKIKEALQPSVRSLLEKYSDPASFDDLSKALGKMKDVKSQMEDNMKAIGDNTNELKKLEAKTGTLASSASVFKTDANAAHNRHWWRWCSCGAI